MDAKSFLSSCLGKVLELGGQDLFLKVGSAPRTRIGGVVKPMAFAPLTEEMVKAIVDELLTDAKKQRLEENLSVDFAFNLLGSSQRFRANVFMQQGTYSFVIRTLWKTIPSFEELKIPEILKTVALSRSGIVLIAGTVASGKTTTLTAMIDMMNRNVERHIITIEDPVEYLHQDDKCIINQREIGDDAHDFTSALRYVVRQSPDCVVIGEMRDKETFEFALASAEVGRLVLATVHAKSVVQIFDRVLGFFPPDEREQVLGHFAYNINCLVCQKIITAKDEKSLIPVIEVMMGNYTTRQLAREKKLDKLPQAMRNGLNEGMQTFDQALFRYWEEGVISQEEALKASERPQEMENQMKGIKMDGTKSKILGS